VHARGRLAAGADGDLDGRRRPKLLSNGQRREGGGFKVTVTFAAPLGVASDLS
jgi:hypothetical protein